jgi:hypothetical protein
MTGINIQAPWSQFLISGVKTVETRSYPLPKRLEGVELALVETPGKSRKFKSRIIGTITFSHSFKYRNETEWNNDRVRHKVEGHNGVDFDWSNDKPKYGWVVSKITRLDNPIDPPKKRGIIYVKDCNI